ncbi:MutS-related protein [Dyadobacter fermentans]|uniref:DNA mismatch repair protein MutS domain protein n=1 Tax=Dyadobacter fermentans (strain ATCC 700827 / DSM 18053 / CIP 107007 / KCTC 52180 / NS114) TaxID=471854 RepID=C6W1B1_DYAFD|nr:hypothetical protein [Dyadobacter fermentans]ACT91968.1 DNA mismatch repair protein MutS domain protein [Dyadobacter fermentans DSM 18053]
MEATIAAFSQNPSLKKAVSGELTKLHEPGAYHISALFQGEHIAAPKWLWLIQLLSVSALASLVLSVFIPKMLIALLLLFPINMGVHYWNKNNIYQYSASLPQLVIMYQIARLMMARDGLSAGSDVRDSVHSIAGVIPQMSVFRIEARLQSEIGQLVEYLVELIKALLLLEPVVLFATLRKLETRKRDIYTIFRFVGETDAALSVLELRESLPHYSQMSGVSDGNGLRTKALYHPLLFNGVSNDLVLNGRSALLTGSNMSGKTTFIRTVGISAILGQTLNTCFASEFAMPRMRVSSSIRISDDLLDQKSYYMEEVLALKQLVEESGGGKPTLFLLDEVLKGTNSIERIAISTAVLTYLAGNDNLVFVSTHDRELADLLSENYEQYHFTEVIEDEEIVFDYKIKPGVLNTTNAIRILTINQFPAHITEEATRLSSKLALR